MMGDNMSDMKEKITTVTRRNRDKFRRPLITDDDFKEDTEVYLSVVKNKTKKSNSEPQQSSKMHYFLSPMRGKVPDRSSFPIYSSKDIDKQYGFLRQDGNKAIKKSAKDEYPEFKDRLFNNQIRREILNKNLKEMNEEKDEVVLPEPPKKMPEPFTPQIEKEQPINIIYEEEIDFEADQKTMTSYEEDYRNSFFRDYERIRSQFEDNTYTNVTSYEDIEKQKKVAEIKELFKDELEEDSDFLFEDEIVIKPEPIKYENKYDNYNTPPIEKRFGDRFTNLQQELQKEINNKNSTFVKDITQYKLPSYDLLNKPDEYFEEDHEYIKSQMEIIDATLASFNIPAKTVYYTVGPTVTRFEIEPEQGTKVSRITSLQDDFKLRLAASDIRIEAPISGKSTVGIEVPNKKRRLVTLREILESSAYRAYKSPLKVALGLDIAGEPVFSDISSMTHALIAGSTGSGKSVCINCIILSILYNALPDEVKLVLIDPKKVEFSVYRDIPHLLAPVVNDPKVACATLKWLTEEMDRRYALIESVGARDIRSYNAKRLHLEDLPKLPYIVVVIDELAELMLLYSHEVEESIQRISQMARAAGIHLIVATQRPSAEVITGIIKNNIPSRISFQVASAIDSRIILDNVGAEKLLGRGDMLLSENGKQQLKRVQGAFVNEEEIERVSQYVKEQMPPEYAFIPEDYINKKENEITFEEDDELFDDAVRYVIEQGEASASKLQRRFKIGYNRAARMIDMMEMYNIIGPQQSGSKPREVLMTIDEYERIFKR